MTQPGIEDTFRAEWPRIVGSLLRYTGSLELAEDSVQQAFERALAARDRALLLNPAAWITTVAKRIAIDTVRRDAALRARLPRLAGDVDTEAPADVVPSAIGEDDRLGLLFVACTPELAPQARLALALRFAGGLPTREVAAVMLVGTTAMNARLTRAKRELDRSGRRLSDPADEDLRDRIPDVLVVIYAMFTVGHTASDSDTVGFRSLMLTAIELARALRLLAPDDPETSGLLALLLLTQSRDAGRLDEEGRVVSLQHADRSVWDDVLIGEGLELAAAALPGRGRFALEAAISGLHCQAADWELTDWESICALYDALVERWPSPSALLARIVARSYSAVGPERALAQLDGFEGGGALDRQVIAARADILRRLGRAPEARAAYGLARSMERNAPVREFYDRQSAGLADPVTE